MPNNVKGFRVWPMVGISLEILDPQDIGTLLSCYRAVIKSNTQISQNTVNIKICPKWYIRWHSPIYLSQMPDPGLEALPGVQLALGGPAAPGL